MKRAAAWAAIAISMVVVGVGAYTAVGLLRGSTGIQRPSSSLISLPGTLYVAQGGALYKLHGGTFKQLTATDGWVQPAVSPDGKHLVAVKQSLNSSDLYLLSPNGAVEAQLTHNTSRHIELNHWAFYPRFSQDGSTVFYSYDPKDPGNSYRVDLAILSRPADPASTQPTEWTQPNQYTGGDAAPQPVNGGLVYTKFSIDAQSQVHSQVWLQGQPGSPGVGLTPPGDDCAQPAVSPDGKSLAMVCRHGQLRSTELIVAPLDIPSTSIGTPRTVVNGELVASPAFSWNGSSVVYLAPAPAGGPFQLWTVAASDPGARPKQVTQNLGLDSTSTPAWVAGSQ
jgi:Tol biopolymer transport system component